MEGRGLSSRRSLPGKRTRESGASLPTSRSKRSRSEGGDPHGEILRSRRVLPCPRAGCGKSARPGSTSGEWKRGFELPRHSSTLLRQIYVQPGVDFPFTHECQKFLSYEMTEAVVVSDQFVKSYGDSFSLTFNISAKKGIRDNEIKGPSVFRKTGDVEYTIFLPFDTISNKLNGENCNEDIAKIALQFLFKGIVAVFEWLSISPAAVREKQDSLIEKVCSDPSMID